jgi:hypothetical protein
MLISLVIHFRLSALSHSCTTGFRWRTILRRCRRFAGAWYLSSGYIEAQSKRSRYYQGCPARCVFYNLKHRGGGSTCSKELITLLILLCALLLHLECSTLPIFVMHRLFTPRSFIASYNETATRKNLCKIKVRCNKTFRALPWLLNVLCETGSLRSQSRQDQRGS